MQWGVPKYIAMNADSVAAFNKLLTVKPNNSWSHRGYRNPRSHFPIAVANTIPIKQNDN